MALNFHFHDRFLKDAKNLQSKYVYFDSGLESLRLICEDQFHPINPTQRIAPGKLHRVFWCDTYVLWKVELVVKGLKSNQFPRVWFAVRGADLVFLCAATHIDNYSDSELSQQAVNLVMDFF